MRKKLLKTARSWVARLRLQHVDADDLVQEALIRGFKSGLQDENEGEWCRVVQSCALDALRTQKRALKAEEGWADRDTPEDPLWERVEDVLEGKDFVTKKLVRLLRAGYSLAESGEACGLSRYQACKTLVKLRKSQTP